MTIDELEHLIHDDIARRFTEYRNSIEPEPEPPSEWVEVPAGGDLQAALNGTGNVRLAANATYAGAFVIARPLEFDGQGSTLQGEGAPALRIAPSTCDVTIRDVAAVSNYAGGVFQAGDNGPTQTTIEQVPRRITFVRCHVPTHRGKRAFEIHAADCVLVDCSADDVSATSGQDAQAVWIHNTTGGVEVRGGSFCADSEIVMVGGDTMKIPGVIPTGILIHDCTLWRPLSWQTDGVPRTVKTSLELKTGIDVTIRDVLIDGCWKDGQDGWAMTFTPRSGGAIANVLVEHCAITNVGGGWNITGHDEPGKPPTPARTTGITIRACTINASKTQYGGRGIVCMVGMSPESVEFDSVEAVTDGTTLITSADSIGGGELPIALLRYRNGSGYPGKYGIQCAGGSANGADVDQWVTECDISGNTFTNANSVFCKNFPENTYLTDAARRESE